MKRSEEKVREKQRDETERGGRRRADNNPAIAPLHGTLVPYYCCAHVLVWLFVYTTTAGLRALQVRVSLMVITPKREGSVPTFAPCGEIRSWQLNWWVGGVLGVVRVVLARAPICWCHISTICCFQSFLVK